jgi:hypothetical protein
MNIAWYLIPFSFSLVRLLALRGVGGWFYMYTNNSIVNNQERNTTIQQRCGRIRWNVLRLNVTRNPSHINYGTCTWLQIAYRVFQLGVHLLNPKDQRILERPLRTGLL